MTIEFKPLSDALGAEVIGIKVADKHSDEIISEIRLGWLRHKILLFRNQDLTIETQKKFARRFGKFKISPQADPWIPEHPEVIVFSNIKVDGEETGVRADTSFGEVWHNDFVQLKEPAGGSFFYAKVVPKKGGDDTWYANQTMAYDALPEETKIKLQGLHWRYSQVNTFARHGVGYQEFTEEQKRNLPDVCHPIVRTHPETGEKALFVGMLDTHEASVDDMSKEEGIKFLDDLRSFATQSAFTYTHEWRQGDCIFWDNRCTMHRASNFPEENGRRLCYRVTLEGGVPF